MSRLQLRIVVAGVMAATVVLGAVACAAYGQAVIAAALSIYALAVGAWLCHSIERYVVARRITTVRSATKPFEPLLPVMAAIIGLMQAVVRSLTDVAELPQRGWDLPLLRWMDSTRATRRIGETGDERGR